MYPANYFGFFPPFPRQEKVFVAMSFDPRFEKRWLEVISPGISNVSVNDKRLKPLRVDNRRISDSILTEILSGVGTSRLFLADITTIGIVNGSPVRNANVMYEVGIAHSVRLPEEVLLFRSDKDRLPFDVANVRVNDYAPDETPDKARTLVSDCIIAALSELNLQRNLAVGKAIESLDSASWMLLMEAVVADKGIDHPRLKTPRQVLGNAARVAAIQRLLELGAIKTSFVKITSDNYEQLKDSDTQLLTYECTEFGRAVCAEGAHRMGLDVADILARIEAEETP